MSLLYLLLLVHLIVDFMQPSALVKWSKKSTNGLLVHSSIYAFLNALILAYVPLWWLWVLVLGISHFVVDKAKVILNNKMPKIGLLVFVLDQVVHISIIVLLFFLVHLGSADPSPQVIKVIDYPQVLLYAVGYIAATFGGSILIFEVLNSMIKNTTSKKVISVKERFKGIFERGIAMTLILLGHTSGFFLLVVPLAFIPSVIQGKKALRGDQERTRFLLELVTSLCLAFSTGIILYFL